MTQFIELENFRAFGQRIHLHLRPITVLIGKNSAGKSTLVKFLLMLRQTLEAAESDFLVTEGRHVDLGGFSYLRNTSNGGSRLRFQVKIASNEIPSNTVIQLHKAIQEQRSRLRGPADEFPLTVNLKKQVVDVPEGACPIRYCRRSKLPPQGCRNSHCNSNKAREVAVHNPKEQSAGRAFPVISSKHVRT